MSNVPVPVPEIASIVGTPHGQIFDANAQCKLLHGPAGVYSQVSWLDTSWPLWNKKINQIVWMKSPDPICTRLMCFTTTSSIEFRSFGPAFDGTTCGSGMVRIWKIALFVEIWLRQLGSWIVVPTWCLCRKFLGAHRHLPLWWQLYRQSRWHILTDLWSGIASLCNFLGSYSSASLCPIEHIFTML